MEAKAIEFWTKFNELYQNERIAQWIEELKTGADWFRNFGLANIAMGDACRIGRIGFDDAKHDRLKAETERLLIDCGLTPGNMQN
jgi:hypothetical protein